MNSHTTSRGTTQRVLRPSRLGSSIAVLLVLGLCSCSSSRNQFSGDPFAADYSQQTINAHNEADDETAASVESALHMQSAQANRRSSQQPLVDGNLQRVSGFHGGNFCPDPNCPTPAGGMGGGGALFAPAGAMILGGDDEASPAKYPDEYIYDGGDRNIPVHYSQYDLMGLDPEDAIAEYRNELGVRNIKESTRVAVYSPRFAAVSIINSLEESVLVNRAAGAEVSDFGVDFTSRAATFAHDQNIGSERMRTRARASELDTEAWATALDVTKSTDNHTKTINLFEEYAFLRTGVLTSNEQAAVQKAVQAAAEWSRREYPVIAAKTTGPNEVYDIDILEEVTGFEEPDRKARIRLIKLADKGVAKRGEVVTFTIRFDNLGDRPVGDVVIMDNLTTRLTYIPDTATSDRAGEFSTEDNEAGSLILRWELDKPLAGGEGGVVTFQARVE